MSTIIHNKKQNPGKLDIVLISKIYFIIMHSKHIATGYNSFLHLTIVEIKKDLCMY